MCELLLQSEKKLHFNIHSVLIEYKTHARLRVAQDASQFPPTPLCKGLTVQPALIIRGYLSLINSIINLLDDQ